MKWIIAFTIAIIVLIICAYLQFAPKKSSPIPKTETKIEAGVFNKITENTEKIKKICWLAVIGLGISSFLLGISQPKKDETINLILMLHPFFTVLFSIAILSLIFSYIIDGNCVNLKRVELSYILPSAILMIVFFIKATAKKGGGAFLATLIFIAIFFSFHSFYAWQEKEESPFSEKIVRGIRGECPQIKGKNITLAILSENVNFFKKNVPYGTKEVIVKFPGIQVRLKPGHSWEKETGDFKLLASFDGEEAVIEITNNSKKNGKVKFYLIFSGEYDL